MPISERRLDWAVMQAKSELARQGDGGVARYDDMPNMIFAPERFDIRMLVAVVLEAGDAFGAAAAALYLRGACGG